MSNNTVAMDLDAIEAAARAALQEPVSTPFLVKTNSECKEWMQSFYNSVAIPGIDRHCTWAWQEQERRHAPVLLELIRLAREHDQAQVLAVIDELSEQNRHLAAESSKNATRHLEVATELRIAKLSLEAKVEKLPPIINGDTVIVKTNDIRSREDAVMLAQLIRRVSPPGTSIVFVSAETEIEAIHEDTMELRGWVKAERAVGLGRTDVDTKSLRAVLSALTSGDGYRIRELQAMMALPDSPIRVLVDQFLEKNGGDL